MKYYFRFVLVFLAYIAVSILFTFPLILRIGDSLPGSFEMDSLVYMWNVDTFWNEIFKFHNPFFTNRIFYPIGANLIFHTYGALPSIFGIFFLNNLILYMNLLVITSLALSAFACFILLEYLTKDLIIAFVSGLIYGFSPIMISFVLSQHYYFAMAAPFLPLGLLMVFKFFDGLKTRYLAYVILLFWMCFFTDYYTTILFILILFIVTIIFLLHSYFKRREFFYQIFSQKQVIGYIKVIFSSLILPLLFLFIFAFPLEEFRARAFNSNNSNIYLPSFCNTNLAGFFIPSEVNPLLKNLSDLLMGLLGKYQRRSASFDTPSYFLGWGILEVAIISFLINFKNKYVLSAVFFGIVIFLLSFGTIIRFGEIEIASQKLTIFYWLSRLPFLGLIDCPIRFPIGTQLSIAILVGILAYKIKSRQMLPRVVIIGVILVLFCSEYGTWNMQVWRVFVPSIYKQLSKSSDNYTVLELPSGITESKGSFGYDGSIWSLHSKQMYWQTIYQKPRLGAYLSRVPESIYDFYKNEPIISDLFRMTSFNGEWSGTSYSKEEVLGFLNRFNIGYIVLSPNLRQSKFVSVIEDLFGDYIVSRQESQGYILYKIKRN